MSVASENLRNRKTIGLINIRPTRITGKLVPQRTADKIIIALAIFRRIGIPDTQKIEETLLLYRKSRGAHIMNTM